MRGRVSFPGIFPDTHNEPPLLVRELCLISVNTERDVYSQFAGQPALSLHKLPNLKKETSKCYSVHSQTQPHSTNFGRLDASLYKPYLKKYFQLTFITVNRYEKIINGQ